MKSTHMGSTVPGMAIMALMLAGCGAGAGAEEESAPPSDSGLYRQMVSYCQATPPAPGESVRDGWVMSFGYSGKDGYAFESNAIVSADGSSAEGLGPVALKTGVHDYRGLASGARIVPSGYANPDWNMGAVLSGTMRTQSVACVVQLAKTRSAWNPPVLPAQQPSASTSLYWRSYWNEAVPMAQLPGYQIDGFEFVANFTPADGQVYFRLDKGRHPVPQAYSICHLAPGTTVWTCSVPELGDGGSIWQLRLRGLAPGVYVLNAPDRAA